MIIPHSCDIEVDKERIRQNRIAAEKARMLQVAAPDLLAALHDIVENSGDIVAVSVAKAAIQKAEGK